MVQTVAFKFSKKVKTIAEIEVFLRYMKVCHMPDTGKVQCILFYTDTLP